MLYALARALRATGGAGEAKEMELKVARLRRALAEVEQNALQPGRLNGDGVELEKLGRIDTALERYRAALDLDPENGVFRRNLGLALCRLGRWEEGIQELREALRRSPDDRETQKALYIALDQADAARRAKEEDRK